MSGRSRTAVRIVAVGALAFLLTGCLKMDIHLSLSSDNTVDGTMILAFDKQLLELTGQNAQDIIGSAAPIPSGTQGVSSKPYDDGKFVGQEFTFDAVPLSQFSSEDPTAINIVREGDVFKVSGTLDLSTGTDTGGNAAVEQALQSAEVKIAITFPGEVTDTNGQVDGTTVTWSPKIGEKMDIQATGSAIASTGSSLSSSAAGWVAVAVFLFIAAAVGVLLLVRRQRAARLAAESGGAPAQAGSSMAPTEAESSMAEATAAGSESHHEPAPAEPAPAEPGAPAAEEPEANSEEPETSTTAAEASATEELPPPPA